MWSLYRAMGRHVGDGEFYWALGCIDANIVAPAPPTPDAAAAAAADAAAAIAAATFATWPPAQAALAATPRGRVLQQRLCDRPPLEPEALAQAGGVTLLGDALHAMIPSLGQGACSALEGALELAQCIAAAAAAAPAAAGEQTAAEADVGGSGSGDASQQRTDALHAALRRYEAARLARATAIQLRSATAGAAAYGGKPGQPRGGTTNGGSVAAASVPATAATPMESAAAATVPRQAPQSAASMTDWLFRYESPHADVALEQPAAACS
jgi:hypothetical protein